MANKGFPLIPVSLLIEDDNGDSLRALVKQHKAAGVKPKAPSAPDKSATSRKSLALSQLAKAFKGKPSAAQAKDKSDLPAKPKTDTGLKKAGAAIAKIGAAMPSAKPAGRDASAPASAGTGAGKKSAMAQKPVSGEIGSVPKFKDPHMDVEHPPGKHEAFHHDTPSLKERTRPDVIPFDERHKDFHDRYHAKGASLKEMEAVHGSMNGVFRGKMDDDTEYVSKPHGAGHASFEPHNWGKRHGAVARILSHMGADHMIAPGMELKGHASEMMPAGHGEGYGPSAHEHAGQKTFIGEWVPNSVKAGRAEQHEKDAVDGDHRLMGVVTHLLTYNSDGHGGNVMIDKEHGHPVFIDQDLSMHLGVKRGKQGLGGVRSIFGPEGAYDYQAKLGKVGNKFPPRMKKTLEWLAGGGHNHPDMHLGVDDKDSNVLQGMAKALLKHGVEHVWKSIPGAKSE
jgi:hypothetical protein